MVPGVSILSPLHSLEFRAQIGSYRTEPGTILPEETSAATCSPCIIPADTHGCYFLLCTSPALGPSGSTPLWMDAEPDSQKGPVPRGHGAAPGQRQNEIWPRQMVPLPRSHFLREIPRMCSELCWPPRGCLRAGHLPSLRRPTAAEQVVPDFLSKETLQLGGRSQAGLSRLGKQDTLFVCCLLQTLSTGFLLGMGNGGPGLWWGEWAAELWSWAHCPSLWWATASTSFPCQPACVQINAYKHSGQGLPRRLR